MAATVGQHRLFFEVGSTALKAGQEERLQALAGLFGELDAAARGAGKTVRVDVLGHADRTGTEAFNWSLSRERAEAIVAALAASGVDTGSFHPVAMGEVQARREGTDPQQLCATFKVRIGDGRQQP